MPTMVALVFIVAFLLVNNLAHGFHTTTTITTTTETSKITTRTRTRTAINEYPCRALPFRHPKVHSQLNLAYVPPEEMEDDTTNGSTATIAKKSSSLHPKIGDVVRYYDLDGGKENGEELVGKITFLTSTAGGYIAELTELENVGDGYYAEYSSQKRMSKKTDRNLEYVSPIMASFVRSEQAYKVPLLEDGVRPSVRQERYDLDDFKGLKAAPINQEIVEEDGVVYGRLKLELLKNAALTGLVGSVLVNVLKGPEDALIYFFGALASVGYLFFLSVKTDTLASEDTKLGNNVSNLRFLMPVFVIIGVALYNQSLGDANPVKDSTNPLESVTKEQFTVAVIGFLTYRLPLFLGQLRDAFADQGDDIDASSLLPGSAGVALQLAKSDKQQQDDAQGLMTSGELVPVLLVSGPQATGRAQLVQQLLAQDDRLVTPTFVDRISDSVTFERLMSRDEFLQVDPTGRYGLTKDSILTAAAAAAASTSSGDDVDNTNGNIPSKKVVVVDASVDLAKRLQSTLSGARLIGVWVGLNSVSEFEQRLQDEIASGKIVVPEDETEESVLRARIREIVSEIEFGLSSGIFEFTILNEDPNQSLKELKEAAGYCFK